VNRPRNILLAEDNDDDVFLLQEAFKKARGTAPLHVVMDGLHALAYLNGDEPYSDRNTHPFPDVLLLDINMPQKNGFEVLEWVRRHPRCSPLVVHILTASPRQADIQRAYDLRANSYVIKPTRVDELITFVTALHDWHGFIAFPQCLEVPRHP
jgi:CheY-like chemotaxis protein